MKSERIQQIEQYIFSHEIVTMQELLDTFGISMNTLRRDLNELSARGSIEKVYGGARRREAEPQKVDQLVSYSERNVRNPEQKDRIAGLAAAFVEEDDTIFIDTGTSTVPLLRHLQSFQHLTIITNSVYVLHSALEYPQFTIIGLPGRLKHKTASLVGEQCVEMLERYNIGRAFMACTAFSLDTGATNTTIEEFDIKKKVLERSRESYLLVDASKFGKTSLLTFGRAEDFDCILTDSPPGEEYMKYFRHNGIRLVLPDDVP